ncbi:ferric reductase-like transmembrane domain-containing protein [Candidatus Gottesmanbacteria bacterium]|nr:ferric reductase-like transmembrane domain-containing protein [Candidatus Gottesmanbacteria bacterium]
MPLLLFFADSVYTGGMAVKNRMQTTFSASGESVRQYMVALVVSAVTVWLIYRYGAVRYGVEGLSTLNKSLATSTLFLLGIVLLLGPLSRLFTIFDHFLKYRKELGIVTFFTGLFHVYLSMFPLARRGPFGFYQSQPLSAYAGLTGLVIMFLLLIFSVGAVERLLGTRLWWKLQYWGARLAFGASAFHFVVLKYQGMVQWFGDRGAGGTQGMLWLPPISLLAAVFAVFVLVVRLSELFGPRAARVITQLSFLAATALTVWLFI